MPRIGRPGAATAAAADVPSATAGVVDAGGVAWRLGLFPDETGRGQQCGQGLVVVGAVPAGGVVVFGDPIGSGVFEGLARGLAFAAVIAAAAVMPNAAGPKPTRA